MAILTTLNLCYILLAVGWHLQNSCGTNIIVYGYLLLTDNVHNTFHSKHNLLAMAHIFRKYIGINRIREMVSFEPGKEKEKDVFHLVMRMGQRKNSESPWGIEP